MNYKNLEERKKHLEMRWHKEVSASVKENWCTYFLYLLKMDVNWGYRETAQKVIVSCEANRKENNQFDIVTKL